MRFRDGEAEAPLAPVRDLEGRTGTAVTFLPSKKIFTMTEFDFATLEHRLRELAFLNSGVTLKLVDARGVEPKAVEMHYDGGLQAFVNWLDRSKAPLPKPAITVPAERDGLPVQVVMQWPDRFPQTM